jgi:hypothetical protein
MAIDDRVVSVSTLANLRRSVELDRFGIVAQAYSRHAPQAGLSWCCR